MKTCNKVALVFLSVLSVFSVFFSLNSIAFAAQDNPKDNPKKIELNGFVIDVTKTEADDTRIVVGKEKDKNKKWIVQFTGPINETNKEQLLATGCRIGDYIPEFAFIVAMDEETKKKVEELPFIEGVVKYKPEYKIEKSLWEKVSKKEITTFHIRADSHENLPVLLSAVLKAKGEILHVGRDVARVKIDPGTISKIANLEEALWIEGALDLKLLNDTSKWTIQTYVPGFTKIWDKGLRGERQLVGIGDTGLDHDMPWFRDASGAPIGPTHRKIAGYTSFADDYDGDFGHGTHVAGTVGGNRTPVDGGSDANGMAPLSKFFIQDLSPGEESYVYPPSDLGLMFITPYYAGARIHTNSWGASANIYDTYARTADLFMWERKDFLALFANGNAGGEGGTEATVGTPATSKNAVSVGATENGLYADNMAPFSSNGPAVDGRIKPTVTAPGVNIFSADSDGIRNSGNSGTVAMSGTSMATPTVAGAAALVRQYYEDGYWPNGSANTADAFEPSAALIKATLINSAQDMTGAYTDAPIPSTGQGWGRINLSNTLHFFGDNKFLDVVDAAGGLVTSATWSRTYFSTGNQALKITLVWSDYPAAEGASIMLVNDLDLTVTDPDGIIYRGNVFQNGASGCGGSADRLNVEEQVLIPASSRSGNYAVTVTGHNVPYGPQPFAVVVTGAVNITSAGFIYLDKTSYGGSDTIKITVGDRDLNLDTSVAETVAVHIKSSTTEPAGETVLLVESGQNTGMFTGSIATRNGVALSGDGYLGVAEGDTITVTYDDFDDGTGKAAFPSVFAHADLTPPLISAITHSVGQDYATIAWTANEAAAATLNYGETSALGASRSDPWLMTSQSVTIHNLKENITYYYEVTSTDEAGNVGRDNNGGTLYTFTTLNLPPNLTVYSSNYTNTYQPDTMIYGTATDPSGVAQVSVNGTPASYRTSDGYYELTVPLLMGENLFTVVATDTLGNSKTLSITVTREAPPDLVIDSVAGPAKGGWSEPIIVNTTVCNPGAGVSHGSGWIQWFLSTDPIISPAQDTGLLTFYSYGDDIPSAACVSVEAEIKLNVSISLVSTTYYLGACVDVESGIQESNETNNCRVGNLMTIEGPDLVVSSLSAPTSVLTDTAFAVSNSVVNSGLGANGITFDLGIYLSTDTTITTSDIRIGSRRIGWLEPVGSPYAQPSESSDNTVVTIPGDVPAGTYYVGAIADYKSKVVESNETNNARVGNQIQVGPSSPPGVTISPTTLAVTEGGAGATYTVVLTSQPVSSVTISVAPSSQVAVNKASLTFTSSSWSVAQSVTVTAVDDAVAEGTHSGTITHTAAGGGYDGVTVASVTATITDNDGAKPDLVMSAVSSLAQARKGAKITVNNTVKNTGSASSGAFSVGIYLSSDKTITSSDIYLGRRSVAGLAAGASSAGKTTVTLPSSAGTYYIGAIADHDYKVVESNEINNALGSTSSLVIK